MSVNDSTKHRQNLKVGDYGHLSDLKRGQVAKVLDFHNDNAALKRHLTFFNVTPAAVGPVLGVTAALEEAKANAEIVCKNLTLTVNCDGESPLKLYYKYED